MKLSKEILEEAQRLRHIRLRNSGADWREAEEQIKRHSRMPPESPSQAARTKRPETLPEPPVSG